MKNSSRSAGLTMMLLLVLTVNLAPVGIRPGPPPSPLATGLMAASNLGPSGEARKPGPPPDPLRGVFQA